MNILRAFSIAALGVLLCDAAPAATAAGIIDNAALRTILRYGYATDADETLEAAVELLPSAELGFGDAVGLRLSGRIRGDEGGLLEPDGPNLDGYSDGSRPRTIGTSWTVEIRDAYLDLSVGNGLLRMGKQQIVWGAMDGIKVLDALNPQSFREFILEDFGASRIGLWSAYLDMPLAEWRAELALVPDTTTHQIPGAGAWFELTAPRYRFGATTTAPTLAATTQRPTDPWADGTIGVRLSRFIAGVDVRLVAISGLDFEPLGRLQAGGAGSVLEKFYERRELFGISLETAFGPTALRAELGFQPSRTFNARTSSGLGIVERDQWRAAIGADIDGPWGTFINVQYVYDRVLDAPPDLVRPSTDHVATLFLRRGFSYDTLTAELRWYAMLDDRNGVVRGSLDYALDDDTRIRLSADAFYGNDEGIFGQFNQRDRVTLTLEHTF